MIWKKKHDTLVGKELTRVAVALFVLMILAVLLTVWQFYAETVDGFAINYSAPSLVWESLTENFYLNVRWHLTATLYRVVYALLLAFFVAYPLGSAMTNFGWPGQLVGMSILVVYAVPKIDVIYMILEFRGYNEGAVLLITTWTAFIMMMFFGYLAGHSMIRDKEMGRPLLQAAQGLGANAWQRYWRIMRPHLAGNQIHCLQVLSISVFTAVSFAELAVSANVNGLGGQILKSANQNNIDRMLSFSFILACTSGVTWYVVWGIEKGWKSRQKRLASPIQDSPLPRNF